MPGHLMVLNPKRRKAKRRPARRKMTALQKKYFGKRRTKRAAAKVVVVSSNPRERSVAKRRRRRHSKTHHRVARRHYRRNPIDKDFIGSTLYPAAIGAGGALLTDFIVQRLPLPASLQGATAAPVVQIGVSVLAGMAVGAMAGSKIGGEVAAGGVIVALYNLFSSSLAASGAGAGANGTPALGTNGMGTMGQGTAGGNQWGGTQGTQGGNGQVGRYLGFLRGARRLRVGNLQLGRAVGVNPMYMKPGLGFRGRGRQRRLGYIGPARTLGRYLQH